MATKMYHYTNDYAWHEMNHGKEGWLLFDAQTGNFVKGTSVRGLWPHKRFVILGKGNSLPMRVHDPANFGFLEPRPDNWINNKEFPYFWNIVMERVHAGGCSHRKKILILEAEVNPEKTFVVDRGHVENFLYENRKNRGTEEAAYRKYWKSRVLIDQYKGNYCLPEVVTWEPIGLDKLRVMASIDAGRFWEECNDDRHRGRLILAKTH